MVDDVPPWAGDVPAGPPPRLPPEWQQATPGGEAADTTSTRGATGHLGRDVPAATGGRAGDPPDPPGRRPHVLIALGAVAAVLAVVGIAASVGGDSDSAQPSSETPVIDESPGEFDAERVDETIPDVPSATTADRTFDATPGNTLAPLTPDDAPDGPGAATGGPAVRVREPRSSVWEPGVIDLLPPLAAIDVPTEVVALTAGGTLHVIELPSGEMRSIDVGRSGRRVDLVVADRGIVIDRRDDGSADLVSESGEVFGFDAALGISSVTAHQGTDEFIVVAPGDLGGRTVRYLLDDAGGVLEINGTSLAEFDADTSWFAPDGDLVVADAGGLYRLDVGDAGEPTVRISTGEPVVVGPNHVLARSCDEQRECGHDVVDLISSTAEPATIGSAASARRLPDVDWALSPDGGALAFIDPTSEDPIWRVVDLRSGDEFDVSRPGSPRVGAAWAADSSGLFTVERDRLVFYDRALGGQLPVGDFDRVVAVATRPAQPEGAGAPELSAPSGIELVGVPFGGGVVRITLDSGVYQGVDAPELDTNFPLRVLSGRDGVTVASYAGGEGFRLADDRAVVTNLPAGASVAGPAIPTGDGTALWRPVDDSWQSFDLIDAAGVPIGVTVRGDRGTGRGSDGAGALLFGHAGGTDVVGPAGTVPVTSGEVLAVGSGVAYVRECAPGACSTYRVDTVDGTRDRVVDEALTVAREASAAIGTSVSPDGSVAMLDGADGWLIRDTDVGSSTSIPRPDNGSPVIWSKDSRVAVFLSSNRLHVYDGLTGTVDVVNRVPVLRAVAAR